MSDQSLVLTLTADNFQPEVLLSDVPVLVDFWAAWCGPCRMVAPIVEALATEFEGQAKVGKLNIDDCEQLASQYKIQAIPTLLIFQNGKVVDQVVGVASQKTLANKLNGLLRSVESAA